MANKKKQVPVDNLEGFFNAVGAIMTSQLRELALASIEDYFRMFCPKENSYSLLHFPGMLGVYSKASVCVQGLCRIGILPDSTVFQVTGEPIVSGLIIDILTYSELR